MLGDSKLSVLLFGDASNLNRALQSANKNLGKFGKTANAVSSGAGFGSSGVFGLMSRGNVAVAGIAAVGFALKSSASEAMKAQVILGQVGVAVSDAGLNWAQYAAQVEKSAMDISKSSGFDDEAVKQSFTVFVRGQKDVGKSLELSALAANVARGRYTDLATATALVNKAAMGQIGALRRAGIVIDKNASSTEALIALNAAYGNSAEQYSKTASGAADNLRVAVGNLQESLGKGLLPAFTATAQAGVVWANALTKLSGKTKEANESSYGLLGILFKYSQAAVAVSSGLAPAILATRMLKGMMDETTRSAYSLATALSFPGGTFLPGGIPAAPGPIAFGQPGFKPSQPAKPPKQLSESLKGRELDARLSGKGLRSVLVDQAAFLNDALEKEFQLKPSEVNALKSSLLGVTQEIKAMDDQIIADAESKSEAAKSAAEQTKAAAKSAAAKVKAAREKAIAALKATNQAFQDQADAIKSAMLDTFDKKQTNINLKRDLVTAKDAMRVARLTGGPKGLIEAGQNLSDARAAIARNKIANSSVSLSAGPPGPRSSLTVGATTIIINGAQDPEKIARQVISIMQKRGKSNGNQAVGTYPGLNGYR